MQLKDELGAWRAHSSRVTHVEKNIHFMFWNFVTIWVYN